MMRIKWEIDVDEDDPYEAACQAFKIMQSYPYTEFPFDGSAPVFEMQNEKTGEKWSVDLEEPKDDAVLPINE